MLLPERFPVKEFFSAHAEITEAMWSLVNQLDRKKFRKLMAEENQSELMCLIKKEIYRL
ncbi:MAG: hypothetical protein HC906_00740 [Bacteroidales bacterium]|nr:hypothetical protein [Bacteroidales bacterium]